MYQSLITFCTHPAIFTQVLYIFEENLEDTSARCEISKQAWYYFARLFVSL